MSFNSGFIHGNYKKREMKSKRINNLSQNLRKIPILISKYFDENLKLAWKCEISDNYENYKASKYEDINFEDVSFHFKHKIEELNEEFYLLKSKKDATQLAEFVNKEYLNNKCKIWLI